MSGIMNMFVAAKTTIATAVDAFFNYTTLLLNTSSTNGAQNNTFLDSSTNNFSITRNGNTTQGTFTPFSQTGWGNFFDGTGDGFSYSGTVFGSGAWTVELWFYFTGSSFTGPIGFFEGTTDSLILAIMSSTTIRVDEVNVSNDLYTVPTMSANTWYHVAATKDASGNQTLFLNGVRSSTGVTTTSRNFSAATTRIGYSSIGATDFTGYINNLRFVTGTAVYNPLSSTITVPTAPLTAISGTQLLTCQSNRFVDNSTNAFALTPAGTPSVQAFSPFAPTAAYDAAVVGGSGYFDGTGDYLTVGSGTDVDLGTSDFMIEAWYYCLANGTYVSGVISKRVGGAASGWGMTTSGFVCDMAGTWYDSWANPFWVGSTSATGFNSGTSLQKLNQWTHIVVTRQGTDARWFVNGQLLGYFSRTGAIQQLTGSPLAVGLNGTTAEQPFIGFLSNCRVVVGSVPTGYQTSSTTLNAQIFTPPTAPVTTTSQGATSGNVKYIGNFINSGIFDSAAKNDLETRGNAQVSTTEAKFGTTSMYFAADGDFLTTPYSPNLVFGTGDFTFECQLYWTGGANENNLIMNNASGGFNVKLVATTAANWGLDNAYVGQVADFGTAPTKNVWHHIAITRASGTLYAFIDGTQVFSGANSTNFTNTNTWYVASNGFSSAFRITGYIDDLRITKGYARYTASFTPPAAAFPLL
jgi:hypothetical protein